MDHGTTETYLVVEAPRVRCPEHKVVVAAVPLLCHQVGHTRIFDLHVAWLAAQWSKSAATEWMRIVGSIIDRVWKDTAKDFDPFRNLRTELRLGLSCIRRSGDLGLFFGRCVIRSVEGMSEDIAPNDRRREKRIKTVAAIAGVALLGACVAAGVNHVVTGRTADSGTGSPISDMPTVAISEHAYALSLPVLDSWIENDFPNAWIAVSNTLEHVARTLEVASGNEEDYALWVPRFERVITIAEAVSDGDEAAARTAFDPLIAEEPGPYTDVTLDGTLSADPYADATASLLKLETAIATEDRGAARQSVANTAAALSEVVLMMQVDLPADIAPEVLDRLLPAFHAIDDVQGAVLQGNAKDAAAGASQLREALETFETWHLSNAS